MQKELKKIEAADVQVVGVSYDSADVLQKFAKDRKIRYPLLSDPESRMIRAYGVLNEKAGGRAKGVPHPGTFVIARDGKIHAILPGTVRQRHPVADLIKSVKEQPKK